MQYCDHCQVNIRGNKERCPLCKNRITADEEGTREVFPDVSLLYERHLIIRFLSFITVVTIVISLAAYQLFSYDSNWLILMLLGLLSMWLGIALVFRNKNNITKNISWFVVLASGLSVLWDLRTGWNGWSLDYVIPIVCVTAIFAMYLTVKVMRLSTGDYMIYFLLGGLFGIIPILFILFNWLNVIYPSVISVSVSIIFLSAIIIFQGENIKSELNKKMHI